MGNPANIVPFHCPGSYTYDPDQLRLRADDGPPVQVETGVQSKHRVARDRLFVPSTAWSELAAMVAAGMSGRAVGLWLAIRMQAKLERTDWVRVRTHLRESLGFTNRAAHSRALAELERVGLIELQRRKGYAPLVRLLPRRAGGEADG